MRLLALLAALMPCLAFAAGSLPSGPLFMGYYESWTELPVGTARVTRLAQMPNGLDIVAIAFVKPDLVFDGTQLKSTGLQIPFDAPVMKQAIAALKAHNPRVKVVLSVGGSAYAAHWADYAPETVAKLVKALDADGVDLDFEPPNPACVRVTLSGGPGMSCASDKEWTHIVAATRTSLPRPYLITAQAWSVGAYGAGPFAHEGPTSPYTGSMLWLASAPEARELDLISLMAYDAGPAFDPLRAMAAYRKIWAGPLLLGVEVPSAGNQTGVPYTAARLAQYAAGQAAEANGGIMLYAVTEESPDGPSLDRPDGTLAVRSICEGLGRKDCE